VVLLAISCMRWSSEISVTASPAAGVCVVPLVTVPVMVAADAEAPAVNKIIAQSARILRGIAFGLILIFL